MVTFTSSSTVENLLKLIDEDKSLLDNVAKASIGPITANTCEKHGLTVDVEADVYTIDGLVAKIKKFWMVTIDETQYFKTTPFAFK